MEHSVKLDVVYSEDHKSMQYCIIPSMKRQKIGLRILSFSIGRYRNSRLSISSRDAAIDLNLNYIHLCHDLRILPNKTSFIKRFVERIAMKFLSYSSCYINQGIICFNHIDVVGE